MSIERDEAIRELKIMVNTIELINDGSDEGNRLQHDLKAALRVYEDNDGDTKDWPLHSRIRLLALCIGGHIAPEERRDMLIAAEVLRDYHAMIGDGKIIADDRVGTRSGSWA